MQQSLWVMAVGVCRVVLLRGSPERVHYSRRRFIVALILAVLASAGVQVLFYEQHVVFTILRVFAELMMFMFTMVFLTAKVERFRLSYAMLLLVLISLFADCLLLLIAGFSLANYANPIGLLIAAIAFYGASNTVAWALHKPLGGGLLVMAGYVAAVTGLDVAFRFLYEIAAAG